MTYDKRRIEELERRISLLPAGSVAKKAVHGKTYYYHRVRMDGKRKEFYVPAGEVEALRQGIKLRRQLTNELLSLQKAEQSAAASNASFVPSGSPFTASVLTGNALKAFAEGVRGYRHRACFTRLWEYLQVERDDRVFVLYGLRRSGKTTLIRQALLEMSDEELSHTAYVYTSPSDTLASMNADLRALRDAGFTTVVVDEVTFMDDFVDGAALFSDVYAAGGMRIVLSGTDSLGFLFAQDEQLYDRCILLHTTFIPYREFEHVLGISGIDEFIRYGGTMSMGGRNYNKASTFASKKAADEYVDSAIARNIQHSLRCYQRGEHFRALYDLYEAGELTGAINRAVEDINHRFTVQVLTRSFRSSDLALSARNLRADRAKPTDVLDRVDVAEVTARLAKALEIRDEEERSVSIQPIHAREIKEYLDLLDVTVDIDAVDITDLARTRKKTVVAQPGLRYSQVDALVESLLLDSTFADLSIQERSYVLGRIRSEVMGRMMEDIVLLETKIARPDMQVFKLQFAVGEFDMVVFDPQSESCEVFEIKHSAERHPAQYRHLIDQDKCAATEFRYGPITRKVVLYRGEDADEGDVSYVNVGRYLNGLH